MREIYERARKVQIWLVTEDEDSKRAFGTIQRLAQVMDEYEGSGRPLGVLQPTFFAQLRLDYQPVGSMTVFRSRSYLQGSGS